MNKQDIIGLMISLGSLVFAIVGYTHFLGYHAGVALILVAVMAFNTARFLPQWHPSKSRNSDKE